MSKRFNPNLIKIHRSYTIEETAKLFGIHKNTVRTWIKDGLEICDNKKPILILGTQLRKFLQVKRTKHKRKCKQNEIYCVRCKLPQIPAENMAEYKPINNLKGCLIAICPTCGSIINKFTSVAKLARIQTQLDITMPKELEHIYESDNSPINCDFNHEDLG